MGAALPTERRSRGDIDPMNGALWRRIKGMFAWIVMGGLLLRVRVGSFGAFDVSACVQRFRPFKVAGSSTFPSF